MKVRTALVSSGVETKIDSLKMPLGYNIIIRPTFWRIASLDPVQNFLVISIFKMKHYGALKAPIMDSVKRITLGFDATWNSGGTLQIL